MTLTPGMVTMDSTDPEPLAAWWAEQTGAEITTTNDGWFVIIAGGTLPYPFAFQKIDEVTPGKNRIHLDFEASDLDAEAEILVAAGATLLARKGDESFRWITLSDPQGNVFDVSGTHQAA